MGLCPQNCAGVYLGTGAVKDIKRTSAQFSDNALTLLRLRCAGRAPQKRTCATSAPADARRGTGPERARAAGCANRRTGAAGGAGRYSDQAGCRSWADEARTPSRTGKRECAGESEAFGGKIRRSRTRRVRKHPRGVTAARKRPRARANRAAHRPRSGTQRCEMHRTGKRPYPNAI